MTQGREEPSSLVNFVFLSLHRAARFIMLSHGKRIGVVLGLVMVLTLETKGRTAIEQSREKTSKPVA
jgi:hypothetical protein